MRRGDEFDAAVGRSDGGVAAKIVPVVAEEQRYGVDALALAVRNILERRRLCV